jgi:hypothetical protein
MAEPVDRPQHMRAFHQLNARPQRESGAHPKVSAASQQNL